MLTVTIRRPTTITLLSVLQFLCGWLWLLIGIIGSIVVAFEPKGSDTAAAMFGTGACLALGIFQVMCGVGLWKLKPYGRTLQIIGACIGLIVIPVGTVISIAFLVYMYKPGVKLLFSGRTPETFTPDEMTQIGGVVSSTAGTAILIIVAIVLLGIPAAGIIAAVAIPGFIRARIAANEATAVATLRSIVSAEAAYANTNRGFYDSVTCLAQPSACLPNYRGAAFLPENYVRREGYEFVFEPGPIPADPPGDASRTSVLRFAVIASPVSTGTGTRRFCVDDTGRIRFTLNVDAEAGVVAGRCPVNWRTVE